LGIDIADLTPLELLLLELEEWE